MPALYIRETQVDKAAGHVIDETTYPADEKTFSSIGDVYRFGLHNFGRCTGKVYIDCTHLYCETGAPHPIGWIFEKRQPCLGAPDRTYIHETWLMLNTKVSAFVESNGRLSTRRVLEPYIISDGS